MKNIFIIILFCIIFFHNAIARLQSQIFNGDIVSPKDYAFVGEIYRAPEITSCTATLIDKQWVLTASHCVTGEEPGEIFPAETLEFRLVTNLKVKVQKVFTYNPQGRDLDYDVALVKLSQPLFIHPVAIPKSKDNFPIKSAYNVISLGYGASNFDWVKYNNDAACPQYGAPCYRFALSDGGNLRKGIGVTLSDHQAETKIQQCIEFGDFISITYNSATMLGIYSPNGQHVLSGDSGGPLLAKTPQGYVQIGIASWGPRLAGDGYATEYIERDKQKVIEHLKIQPIFYANLLNKNILQFIYDTMRNE